jgi:hypothetical protein
MHGPRQAAYYSKALQGASKEMQWRGNKANRWREMFRYDKEVLNWDEASLQVKHLKKRREMK